MYKNLLIKQSINLKSQNNLLKTCGLSNTFILYHKGNNYKVIERLASFGSNVCVVEQYPKKKERTPTFMIAEEICEKMKRPCVTVLQCDMYNPKYINYAFNETEDIYGSIDGLVIYNKNKWESNQMIHKYFDYVNSIGNIMIIDPNSI